jgi:hypothetical protein
VSFQKPLGLLLLLCSFSAAAAPFDANALQAQLDRGATRITLAAGDESIALDVERTTRTADGDLVVRARPVGQEGWAVLSSSRGQWYGNVRSGEQAYELRHVDGGHELVRTDGERSPAELNPAPWRRAPAVREPRAESVTANAEPSVVDVLLCYTSHLHSLLSETDIRTVANAAIEEANLAYERSGISHRVRLAGLEETNYDESLAVAGNKAWDAARLRMVNGADGFMDEVHARRDALHADAVVLLITRNDACGYAELMTAPPSTDFAPEAYAIVSISCAAKSLALAHELGHLMGLEHEREARTLPFEPAFPYAFGYRQPQDKFRTIMATEIYCQQRCPRVNYFSNPERTSDEGLPLGIPDEANNALALEQTMPIMAAFRSAAVPAMLVRSFAADRTTIERGQSITLSWNTENATSIEIGGLGTVAAIGSTTVAPLQSTTYTLTATQPGAATITSTVNVVVNCGGEPCAVPRRRAARH